MIFSSDTDLSRAGREERNGPRIQMIMMMVTMMGTIMAAIMFMVMVASTTAAALVERNVALVHSHAEVDQWMASECKSCIIALHDFYMSEQVNV